MAWRPYCSCQWNQVKSLRQTFPLCALQVPDHTIVILLGIVFCCVNPLLCVAACLYFCVVWLLNKYDMLYVWQETYQAGGKVNALTTAASSDQIHDFHSDSSV